MNKQLITKLQEHSNKYIEPEKTLQKNYLLFQVCNTFFNFLSPQKNKMINQCDYLYKIILIGDPEVGKTSLLIRYIERTFSEFQYCVIGMDFKLITLPVGDTILKLQIWDTAGDERFRTITPVYCRGSRGIILVYDISKNESFENVKRWVTQISELMPDKACFLLIGNKCDLEEKRQVSIEEGKKLAKEIGSLFIETSAKIDLKVDKAFYTIASTIYNRQRKICPKLSTSTKEFYKSLSSEKNKLFGCFK